MIEEWLKEVKEKADPENLGMVLIHNGVVRATSKIGKAVKAMQLSYDEAKLADLIAEYEKKEGIEAIRVWINKGDLQIGDDIMFVLIAGRFRTDVLPAFQSLMATIKGEIVREHEIE